MEANDVYDNEFLFQINAQIQKGLVIHTKKNKPYNPFDIEETDEPVYDTFQKIHNGKITCEDCQEEMSRSSENNGYMCHKCGRIEESDGDISEYLVSGSSSSDVSGSYNTSSSSATPIRMAGPGHYYFQKKLVSNTSNYKKTQKKNTDNQMLSYLFHYNGTAPNKVVTLEASELYLEVQQHCIKRGDVRKGCMAACLYRKCKEHGITRKPREIADMFGIPQNELSNGEKILDNLIASGLIKMKKVNEDVDQANTENMHSFLDRYFHSFNIPIDESDENIIVIDGIRRPNYKKFACQLIRFTIKYRIATSSVMSSKCAGALYIISTRRKELEITRASIETECDISRSTFTRFAHYVCSVLNSNELSLKKVKSRLTKLFSTYDIPLK